MAKSWCYTLNNWTESEFSQLKNYECQYHIIGKEKGENGTEHLQGYITFKQSHRIKSLKKLNSRIHWEPAIAREQAINYCMKDDKDAFIKDNRKQGQRSDLIKLATELNEGKSVTEVAKAYPSDYIRYHAGIEKYAKRVQLITQKAKYTLESCCKFLELSPLENYTNVVIGAPCMGKTQYALAHFKQPLFVTHIDDLLDLNELHDGIVFDDMDFRHWHRTHIIHLVDYEQDRSIHCRYRTAKIPAYTLKVFCCNEYPFIEDDEAISRRVNVTEVCKR